MKLLRNCTIYLVVLMFIGCSRQYKDMEIEKSLSNVELNTEFSLDTMTTGEWDMVYIAKPYENIDALEINNMPSSVKNSLKNRLMRDSHSFLIFTQKHDFLYYAPIGVGFANFSFLEENKYARSQVYTLDSNKVVRCK